MSGWQWLEADAGDYRWRFIGRVLAKALLLFAAANLLFAACDPLPLLGRVTVYGTLVPPRPRLPYGENPTLSYSLSISNMNALFGSHVLAQPRRGNEFRVVLLGDSSVWGFLLRPDETLAAALNNMALTAGDGRDIHVYNLGYPEMSLFKDLLLLDRALAYQPDLIVWLVTLESFAPERQSTPTLARNNADAARRLMAAYDLDLDGRDTAVEPSLLSRTIAGRRRELADWLRYQLYGFAWAATGIDQVYPEAYTPRASDFEADISWHDFTAPRDFAAANIAFPVLAAGIERAGDTPLLLVNEPMFISGGQNSDLRYNFWYPRWAYDRYRDLLYDEAQTADVPLLDLWDRIAPAEFTDSPVHLTPAGTRELARLLAPAIQREANAAVCGEMTGCP